MKILVYDVAAEDGGGLLLLKEFHEAAKTAPSHIKWIFLTSLTELESTKTIEVRRYPEVKQSWLHRLSFEHKKMPEIIRQTQPDLVISLQNMPVKRCKVRQFVYLHQSLQYCPKKFSFLKKEERALAIRQRLIGWLIKNAMPKAEHIFVQTQWIKDATCAWLKRPEEEVTVVPVKLPENVPMLPFEGETSKVFFYPARAEVYKNHQAILDACRILQNRGITGYRVILPLQPGGFTQRISEQVGDLPIDILGALTYEQVWQHYSKATLLFPSYLETCGLPMLEAKMAGSRILASDMPFSHEALDGYPNARFFPYDDPEKLADCMQSVIEGKMEYVPTQMGDHNQQESLLCSMLSKV